ncbi:MAG: hypothetical protein U9Q83_11700 [Bacteroidota bacterium]|nr:hypothetical protein [Bacteroidota bacterium]
MGEFEFILLTIVIVFIIVFITNRILTKKNRQKKVIPKGEKYNEILNNLETIIKGVSKKESKEQENKEEKEEELNSVSNYSDYEKRIDKSNKRTIENRYNSKDKKKKIKLKDSIIGHEVIKKKKNI